MSIECIDLQNYLVGGNMTPSLYLKVVLVKNRLLKLVCYVIVSTK